MSALVRIERGEGMATVAMNDPERRNGLSPELVDALVAAFESLGADETVRCVILTGTGSAFSAGGNPKRMLQPGLYQDMSPVELRDFYRDGIQRLPLAVEALAVPILAAVNGPAIGAGCDLACLCDMRIAAEGASFASSFVKLGIVPGDGGAWIMPRAVGLANAMEMMLTGDPVSAGRALQMGLVSRVVPAEHLLDEAHALASRVARNPPVTVRLTKKLARDCLSLSLGAALDLSAVTQVLAQKSEDHREAVRAFLEKRPAHYVGK